MKADWVNIVVRDEPVLYGDDKEVTKKSVYVFV